MSGIRTGVDFGATRYCASRVPVSFGHTENAARNRAALGAMDAAQRLTGLNARQLEDEQRRMREQRRERLSARRCICNAGLSGAYQGACCQHCGGRVEQAVAA